MALCLARRYLVQLSRLGPAVTVQDQIIKRLTAAFAPEALDVVNESHLHAGHPGSPGTGESHFRVRIVADGFSGKSRLERHRMVNETLADLLRGPIHALAVSAQAPGEGL
jgi:BolA family transcriptional regulator, general stress-responsive regulator